MKYHLCAKCRLFPREHRVYIAAGLRLLPISIRDRRVESIEHLATLQVLYPDDAAIAYAAYRVDSELAFRSIDSPAINAPDSAQLHRALAEHLVSDGRNERAMIEYRKALAISPHAADLHSELGQAILFESHLDASLAETQKEFESSLRIEIG